MTAPGGDEAALRGPQLARELGLLAALAALWGSSYLWIDVALETIPPVTLVAIRCSLAAAFLLVVAIALRDAPPRGGVVWGRLGLQALLSSVAPWLLLAWGQQYVDSALASVLNSTSPIFVALISLALFGAASLGARKIVGAALGLAGVTAIVGVDALAGLGDAVVAQLAVLASAAIYAAAALHGRWFVGVSALWVATGATLAASAITVPLSLMIDAPWRLAPSAASLGAVAILGVFGTGLALLIYFRLVKTLGAIGVASQAYLRAGVGVALGVIVLGESISAEVGLGLALAVLGVALVNAPSGKQRHGRAT